MLHRSGYLRATIQQCRDKFYLPYSCHSVIDTVGTFRRRAMDRRQISVSSGSNSGIELVDGHQFIEVIHHKTLRTVEIHDVDVGSGRKVKRIIGSAVNHRHRVVRHWPIQFLRDVIGAQGIFEAQIESIMTTEQAVAAGPILAAVSAVSAFAVNIHRNETREIAGQQFTPAVRFTV